MDAHAKKALTFVEALADLRFDNVFNPYADECYEHDLPGASAIRCQNLISVLTAALREEVDSMWVGRDLGYRGGRRTGLALTDEMHLTAHARLLGSAKLRVATKAPIAERTASIVWSEITAVRNRVFLWNVFPFHPHEPGDAMSNRSHSRSERARVAPLLATLLAALRPRQVVAIGRDAATALSELGVHCACVRHPSFGGQTEFRDGIRQIYGLDGRTHRQLELT